MQFKFFHLIFIFILSSVFIFSPTNNEQQSVAAQETDACGNWLHYNLSRRISVEPETVPAEYLNNCNAHAFVIENITSSVIKLGEFTIIDEGGYAIALKEVLENSEIIWRTPPLPFIEGVYSIPNYSTAFTVIPIDEMGDATVDIYSAVTLNSLNVDFAIMVFEKLMLPLVPDEFLSCFISVADLYPLFIDMAALLNNTVTLLINDEYNLAVEEFLEVFPTILDYAESTMLPILADCGASITGGIFQAIYNTADLGIAVGIDMTEFLVNIPDRIITEKAITLTYEAPIPVTPTVSVPSELSILEDIWAGQRLFEFSDGNVTFYQPFEFTGTACSSSTGFCLNDINFGEASYLEESDLYEEFQTAGQLNESEVYCFESNSSENVSYFWSCLWFAGERFSRYEALSYRGGYILNAGDDMVNMSGSLFRKTDIPLEQIEGIWTGNISIAGEGPIITNEETYSIEMNCDGREACVRFSFNYDPDTTHTLYYSKASYSYFDIGRGHCFTADEDLKLTNPSYVRGTYCFWPTGETSLELDIHAELATGFGELFAEEVNSNSEEADTPSTEISDYSECNLPLPAFSEVQDIEAQDGILRVRFTGIWSPNPATIQAGQKIRFENWTSPNISISGDLGNFNLERCHFVTLDEPGVYNFEKDNSGEEGVIIVK